MLGNRSLGGRVVDGRLLGGRALYSSFLGTLMLRIVFMGTSEFAVPSLIALSKADNMQLVGVFTRSDAVSGRGKNKLPSPVRQCADELGLKLCLADSFSDEESLQSLQAMAPDIIVVASYGVILPPVALHLPRLACINVHASLLPRWRGAAPIERAILEGDSVVGVSIMKMEEGLDTGPYCLQVQLDPAQMNRDELTEALAVAGANALIDAIDLIRDGKALWTPQDEAQATYAKKVSKKELRLSPALTASSNLAKVRASSAHAAARAEICGKSMAVTRAALPVYDLADVGELDVGEVDALASNVGAADAPESDANKSDALNKDMIPSKGFVSYVENRLLLGTSDGCFEAISVKPDGKREMRAAEFMAGARIPAGSNTARWQEI